MEKNTTIQIRITKSDKNKLKNACALSDTSISKLLTDYLDEIYKSKTISMFYDGSGYYKALSRELTDEEMIEIVGGASMAIEKEDFNLARNILNRINEYVIMRENKDSFINIRYTKTKKDTIDKIAKNNNTNISELLDNYIKHLLYDYECVDKVLHPTKDELLSDLNKADEDYKNGEYYTLDESNNAFKKLYGDDFVEKV